MGNLLLTIAGALLALWLVSAVLHVVFHLIAWLISIAPLVALVLIVAALVMKRRPTM